MIVTCKGCNTSYNLDDEQVKKTGSKVRCSICKNIFMAFPPMPIEEQEIPESIEEQKVEISPIMEEESAISGSETGEVITEAEEPEVEQVAQIDKEEDKIELSDLKFDEPVEAEDKPKAEQDAQTDEDELSLEELDFADLSESLETGEIDSTEVLQQADDEKDEIELSDLKFDEPVEVEEEPKAEQDAQTDEDELSLEEELDFADLSESLEKGEVDPTEVLQQADDEKDEIEFSDLKLDEPLEAEEEPKAEQTAQTDEDELSLEEELDFADLSESLEKGEVDSTEVSQQAGNEKPETSDSEEIDFSELEKMLENGEINFDNLISEDTEDSQNKLKFSDTEEIDLMELDAAIDNFEDMDIEEIDEDDTKELKLEFENDADAQVLKNKDMDELDFSDLENIPETAEIPDLPEDNEKTQEITFDLDFESESKPSEQTSSEKEPDELDFSDLEKMLEKETEVEESVVKPIEETGELTLELDQPSESLQELKFEDTVALEGNELDFSDLEKMLDNDKGPEDSDKESSSESFDLSMEMDEPSDSKQADYLTTTVAIDEMKNKAQPSEADVPKKAEDDGLEDTVLVEGKIGESEKEEKPSGKVVPPPIKKKSTGKLLLVFALIIALILGTAAFAFFKPFGIEIPFVSDYIESQIDKNGNLKIIPIRSSIKGDFVDTQSGTLFIITGMVKNDYSHPRSNIKVTGEVFNKGTIFKKESVYCGNIISNEDLMQNDPAVIKKRLQNKFGEKKSNISVKPGKSIPFMVIFENPSSDLDEFNVNIESSIKG